MSTVNATLAPLTYDTAEAKFAVRKLGIGSQDETEKRTKKDDIDKHIEVSAKAKRKRRGGAMTDEGFRILRRTQEAVRLMYYSSNKEFRSQTWYEPVMVAMAVDVWAGVPSIIQDIVEAQENLVEQEIAKREGKYLTKKAESDIRRDVRRRMSKQLGMTKDNIDLVDENLEPIPVNAPEESPREDDGRIWDGGILLRSLMSIRKRMTKLARKENRLNEVAIVESDTGLEALMEHVDRVAAGFVLEVLGDERTKTRAGERPCRFMWIEYEETGDKRIDWQAEYRGMFADDLADAKLTIHEVLPKDFLRLPKDSRWDPPSMVESRVFHVSGREYEE